MSGADNMLGVICACGKLGCFCCRRKCNIKNRKKKKRKKRKFKITIVATAVIVLIILFITINHIILIYVVLFFCLV